MKVVFHEDFYPVYTSDPAAASDRMESVVEAIDNSVTFFYRPPRLRGGYRSSAYRLSHRNGQTAKFV